MKESGLNTMKIIEEPEKSLYTYLMSKNLYPENKTKIL